MTAPLPAVAVRLAGVVGFAVGSASAPSTRSNVKSLLFHLIVVKDGVAWVPDNTNRALILMDSSSKYAVSLSALIVKPIGKEAAAKSSTPA